VEVLVIVLMSSKSRRNLRNLLGIEANSSDDFKRNISVLFENVLLEISFCSYRPAAAIFCCCLGLRIEKLRVGFL